MRALHLGAAMVAVCALSVPARALVDRGAPRDPRVIEPRRAEVASVSAESVSSAKVTALRDFLARYRGRWEVSIDPGTGLATLIQGEGIPLYPGRGNSLAPAEGAPMPLLAVDAFVREQRDLIGPLEGSLVLDVERSGPLDEGRLFDVSYDWFLGDVPVEGAGVLVRINSGNIVQLEASLLGKADLDTKPSVAAAEAVHRLLSYAGDEESARIADGPRLVAQPERSADALTYRLVWVVRYKVLGMIETWEGRVDAHSGAVVGFRDVNAYGRVVGGIYPRTVTDTETRVPFPVTRVDYGATFTSDSAGFFPYAGGLASSGLNGIYFNTECQLCTSPNQPVAVAQLGIGQLDFGLGGVDAIGNGASTRSDRNAFYHLGQVRRLGKKWLPTRPWLDTIVVANVNIQDTCNAFWDGLSVNFFRSGGGCNNTGEISDVMQHEWGHGLDQNTRLADGATGEATADITAMHISHDFLVGPSFGTDGSPVRNLNKEQRGAITRANVASFCPAGSGALGYEVHCEGEIYGQTHWDLVTALRAKHGSLTGWRTSERIFFTSLPNAGSYLSTGGLPIYNAYLAADDDDGNLANGTPNGAEIYQAFNAHGIAGAAAVSTPGCARPAQPPVQALSVCDRVSLSWTSVPGADHYEVLRSEVRMDTAYFRLATVPSGQTTYEDLEVAPATDYWYVVMALYASGCESLVENPAHARLTAQPILSVAAATTDDLPRGNRSGFPDPGEEVDLHVTLANLGESAATGVAGSIVPLTPGVTMLDGDDAWPAIAPGASGDNQGILRFVTDPAQVTCGQKIRFQIVPANGSACASASSWFDVLIGKPGSPVVCDATPACYVAPGFAGLDSASPGPSCGETVLAWQTATSHCTNATVSYSLYRSTDPGFVPGPQNLVVAGLTGTSYGDSILFPGATYSYVVRASDSRSGGESNTVRRSVQSPASPDTAPPVFGGVTSGLSGAGCGEIVLGWAPALESCGNPVSYDVYRSTNAFFTPGPDTLVATTFSLAYTDPGLIPGTPYYYMVRSRDNVGNAESNFVEVGAIAAAPDRLVLRETFEAGDGGWSTMAPNDATTGRWEWGDPEETSVQPDNDHTPDPGHSCWVTGLAALGGAGGNDIDGGSTTLRSARYDLGSTVTPFVRFGRWYSNDRGGNPGEDPFVTYVSNDDGVSWTALDTVSGGTPLAWVLVDKDVTIPRTANMRFRFQARDQVNPSLVEAAIDDFEVWDRGQACSGCPQPVPPVAIIRLSRNGGDVILDWSADPVQAPRYVVYKLTGPGFATATRVGSTTERTFVHAGAGSASENHYYRVSAVDACGGESTLGSP